VNTLLGWLKQFIPIGITYSIFYLVTCHGKKNYHSQIYSSIKATMKGTLRNKRKPVTNPSKKAVFIFDALKNLFRPYHDYFEISVNSSDEFEAVTKNAIKINQGNFKTAVKQISFVIIRLYKEYIRLQFHPLYVDTSLLDKVPSTLFSLKKLAITFEFKTLDPELAKEVTHLFDLGIEAYKARNYIR
jgi:hypothetical protein